MDVTHLNDKVSCYLLVSGQHLRQSFACGSVPKGGSKGAGLRRGALFFGSPFIETARPVLLFLIFFGKTPQID